MCLLELLRNQGVDTQHTFLGGMSLINCLENRSVLFTRLMQTCGCCKKRQKPFKYAHVWESHLRAVQLCCLQTLDVISLCNVSQQFFQDLVEVISVESFPFAEPASLSRGLQDKAVAAGASVHFWCNAGGSPAPTLTWLHNAAPLRPSPRHFPSGNHLRICGVTLHDSGLYQCVANNGIGFVQSTGRLRVQPGRSTCSPQELTLSIYALSFMLLCFFFPRIMY